MSIQKNFWRTCTYWPYPIASELKARLRSQRSCSLILPTWWLEPEGKDREQRSWEQDFPWSSVISTAVCDPSVWKPPGYLSKYKFLKLVLNQFSVLMFMQWIPQLHQAQFRAFRNESFFFLLTFSATFLVLNILTVSRPFIFPGIKKKSYFRLFFLPLFVVLVVLFKNKD